MYRTARAASVAVLALLCSISVTTSATGSESRGVSASAPASINWDTIPVSVASSINWD